MAFDDEQIQAYLREVERVQAEGNGALGPDDVRAIALEVGLSTADLDAAQQAASEHLSRGRGYLHHGFHAEACQELERGVALTPHDAAAVRLLGHAYVEHFLANGDRAARDRARAVLQRCIDLNPSDQAAYEMLASLNPPKVPLAIRLRGLPQGLTSVLAGALLWGAWLAHEAVNSPPAAEPTEAPASAGVPAIADPTAAPATQTPSAPNGPRLPVEFSALGPWRALVLEEARAKLDRHPNMAFLTLGANLRNESRLELETLEVRLEILDAEGKAHTTALEGVVQKFHAPLRPGDTQPFHWFTQTSTEAAAVRLTVVDATSVPAPSTYPEAPPLPLAWAFDPPAGYALGLRERHVSSEMGLGDMTTHRVHLEVRNEGTRAIQGLKLRARYIDARGEVMHRKETFVIGPHEPPLLAGQGRPVGFLVFKKFERPVASYGVAVVSLR